MIKYPIQFEAKVSAKSGMNEVWEIDSLGKIAKCSIPPEFEGPGGAFSPEDLFAQALTNCFVATFKVYAEASRLEYSDVKASSNLLVDLNENKKPVMKTLELNVSIHGASNLEKTKMIANKAFNSGFILNSVKTELKFNLTVE